MSRNKAERCPASWLEKFLARAGGARLLGNARTCGRGGKVLCLTNPIQSSLLATESMLFKLALSHHFLRPRILN